jgi:hypothetical protein
VCRLGRCVKSKVQLLHLVLLRKLEPDVLLTDRWTHGHVAARTTPRTKHKARSKLRASSGSDGLGLLLLRSKSGKTWSGEALGQRAALRTRLETGVGDFSVFKGMGSGTFFDDILHHGAQTWRKVVEMIIGKGASTERSCFAVPRCFTACDTRIRSCTGLENRRVGRKVGAALTGGNSRGV